MSLSDIIDGNEAAVCAQPSVLEFRQLCRRLGMLEDAARHWEQWHVKPFSNMVVCMGSGLGCGVLLLVTFTLGSSFNGWYPHVFVFSYSVVQTVNLMFFWRRGPGHSGTHAHSICVCLLILCFFAFSIPAIAGPLPLVPFENRLITTATISLALWLLSFSGYTGGSAADRPEVPHTSFAAPLLTATWVTVRVMDPVTDMILVRLILELVRSSQQQRSISCCTPWQCCPDLPSP